MKKYLNKLKSQEGFTLVELMVAGAVLAILLLGFTAYMYQQAKSSEDMKTKNTLDQLKNAALNTSNSMDTLEATEALRIDQL